MTDTELLDWLEQRGRVKARRFGQVEDNFTWDCRAPRSLRDAIRMRIDAERGSKESG